MTTCLKETPAYNEVLCKQVNIQTCRCILKRTMRCGLHHSLANAFATYKLQCIRPGLLPAMCQNLKQLLLLLSGRHMQGHRR